jgi:hypothetical protein
MVRTAGADRVEHKGHEEIEFAIKDPEEPEIGRQDADDDVRFVFNQNGPADNGGIAAEPALPEAIAEDNHAVAPGLFLVLGEAAAKGIAYAENSKEIGCDLQPLNTLRLIVAAEVEILKVSGGQALKGRVVVSPVEKIGNRNELLLQAALWIGLINGALIENPMDGHFRRLS